MGLNKKEFEQIKTFIDVLLDDNTTAKKWSLFLEIYVDKEPELSVLPDTESALELTKPCLVCGCTSFVYGQNGKICDACKTPYGCKYSNFFEKSLGDIIKKETKGEKS